MKKIIVMIFLILLVLFTSNLKAAEQAASDISKLEAEIKGILKTVSPSILKVVTENHKKNFATGIAIDPSHVISNIKVVQRPYNYVYIETIKGERFAARVIGKDQYSSLILLRINKNALTPIKYANGYEVGDWVALVGAFYQEFPSIYQGILSSASEDQVILNAPVVPGSPGGAVVNKKGELIGVIRGRVGFAFSPDYTFKDHSGEIHIEIPKSQHKDLCAAVPAVKVEDISQDLKKYGKVRRGWLGVSLDFIAGKIEVANVVKNSPAEKADLRKGDIIEKINGKRVKTSNEVVKLVKTFKPYQKLEIGLTRNSTPRTVVAVIGEARESEPRIAKIYKYSSDENMGAPYPELIESLPVKENFIYQIGGNRTLGVDVTALTPELAKEFNIAEGNGLMITRIYKDSAAEKVGFRPADIIVKIGNLLIKDSADLRKIINELEDEETVTVEFYRKGKIKQIDVVPDKSKGFGFIFDRFRDKMRDINIQLEEGEAKLMGEEVRKERDQLQQLRKKYLREIENIKKTELEKYQIQMEKMLKEQEKMRNEILKLKQELEKEKKENEKPTTKI